MLRWYMQQAGDRIERHRKGLLQNLQQLMVQLTEVVERQK